MDNGTEKALSRLRVLTNQLELELRLTRELYAHYHDVYEKCENEFEANVALGQCVVYNATSDMLEFNIRLHKEYMAELEGGAE